MFTTQICYCSKMFPAFFNSKKNLSTLDWEINAERFQGLLEIVYLPISVGEETILKKNNNGNITFLIWYAKSISDPDIIFVCF